MAKTFTNKTTVNGDTIRNNTAARKRKKTNRKKKKSLFEPKNFVLPNDNTYIHTTVGNFHREFKQLGVYNTLINVFKSILQEFQDEVDRTANESKTVYEYIVGSGPNAREEFLQYFAHANKSLNDLLAIKTILRGIRMALNGQIVYKPTTDAGRVGADADSLVYYRVTGMQITGAERCTPQEAAEAIAQSLLPYKGSIITDYDHALQLANGFIDLGRQAALSSEHTKKKFKKGETLTNRSRSSTREQYTKLWASFGYLQKLVGNTIIEKLTDWCNNWKQLNYRSGTCNNLMAMLDFPKLITYKHFGQDAGYLGEVVKADALGGKVVGDDDNKNTATDIDYIIETIDGTVIPKFTESLKTYQEGVFTDDKKSFTWNDLESLMSNQTNALQQLDYFLSNYFVLGQAELAGETTSHDNRMSSNAEVVQLYDTIVDFLKKVAFFAVIFQGSATSGLKKNQALPMLLTINNQSIFTYELWNSLSKYLTSGGVEITMPMQLALSADGEFKQMRSYKKRLTTKYKKTNKPFTYSEFLGNDTLMTKMAGMTFSNHYRSQSFGQTKVAVSIATIMNNQGGQ